MRGQRSPYKASEEMEAQTLARWIHLNYPTTLIQWRYIHHSRNASHNLIPKDKNAWESITLNGFANHTNLRYKKGQSWPKISERELHTIRPPGAFCALRWWSITITEHSLCSARNVRGQRVLACSCAVRAHIEGQH